MELDSSNTRSGAYFSLIKVDSNLFGQVYSFHEIIQAYHPSLIINCVGLGAKELNEDHHMFPIRGVLLRLDPKEHSSLVGKVFLFDDDPAGVTYIIGRPDGIFVGGMLSLVHWLSRQT